MPPAGVMEGFPPPPEQRVTLDNWQLPPFNRWSFQHVSEVVRTARIPRSGPVWELPTEADKLMQQRIETTNELADNAATLKDLKDVDKVKKGNEMQYS